MVIVSGWFLYSISNPLIAQSSENFSTATYSDECSAFIDCDSTEEQKLIASDADVKDWFGISVSIDGDHAIVGAVKDSCIAGDDCGSAYIYRFNGIQWIEEQKLTDSLAEAYDQFGISVAIRGNLAIVGSWGDNCALGENCGSAHIYRFNGTDWNKEKKLTASDALANENFGNSVSLSDDRAIVGVRSGDHEGLRASGSVYIYHFDGVDWIEEQKLTAFDASEFDAFGVSVSIDDDSIIVGSWGDDCFVGQTFSQTCGSAYVFRLKGGRWIMEQKLTASDPHEFDFFGKSVSICDKTIVIGAPHNDCDNNTNCGAVYVFRFDGSIWFEEQKIIPSVRDVKDLLFGNSVSIEKDSFVVGTIIKNCIAGSNCGVAVYRFDGTSWVEERQLIASGSDAIDWFGISVFIDGGHIIVGSQLDPCEAGEVCGSAYIFDLTSDDCDCDGTADVCELDTDKDGLVDDCDKCTNSITDETIVINGCDTNVANIIFDDGCTMADVIAECQNSIQRIEIGKNVSCTIDHANEWLRSRLITGREYSQIVTCAANSNNQRRSGGTNNQRRNANINSNYLRQQP